MAGFDAEAYRAGARDAWERAAAGWSERRAAFQAVAMPVSQWMAEAVHPQPGHRVLELAAGPGDTGFLVAELIAPGGTLITSDASEGMLDAARARAEELGLGNVEFRALNAESIALPAAGLDAVLCRWGYMLLADPGAALGETRRVLRPGGRVALAAWDRPEHNVWAAIGSDEMQRLLDTPPPNPDQPGMFAFAEPGRTETLLEDAGFSEVEVAAVDLNFTYDDEDAWWEDRVALSVPFADALARLDADRRDHLREAIDTRLGDYRDESGRLTLPARTLVAAATA
ncbi:MAG TPA: methyltransferase domain-containing protein [Solirubrobacteraceae bacterium]|jgi:SAM-dependent methyltransferase|nr:methyltransferase domain-containing protein [Solirubrobacteraceae bacterium]